MGLTTYTGYTRFHAARANPDCMLDTRCHTALETEIMNLQRAMHNGLNMLARQFTRGDVGTDD